MMAAIAAIILAHENPSQVRRLVGALAGTDVFLHCDRRSPDAVLAAMVAGAPESLQLTPRVRTRLFSWSLVEAELVALRTVIERSAAEHIVVLSGSCYPLVSVADLEDELALWRGRSRLAFAPLPWAAWGTPRNPDGGAWRVRRRFVTFGGQVVRVGGVPLRAGRRSVPSELRLCGADQWKIYARDHAVALLRVLDDRPDLVRFWRGTFIPDELCVPSILGSPALVGEIAETMTCDRVWYVRWDAPGSPGSRPAPVVHPRWLHLEDLTELDAARSAEPRKPGAAEREGGHRKLFARKFAPRDEELVALIDERRGA